MNYSKTRVLNKSIPDENYNGVFDTVNITKSGKIRSVKVNLDVKHSNTSDLAVELTGPNGKTITLDGPGKGMQMHYSGSKLDVYKGISSKGDWSLKVLDVSKSDKGSLRQWELILDIDSKDHHEINTHKDYKLVSSQTCHQGLPIGAATLQVKLSDNFDTNSKLSLQSPKGTVVPLPFTHTRQLLKYSHHLDVLKGENPKGEWKILLDSKAKGRLVSWKLGIHTQKKVEVKPDDLTKVEGIGPKIQGILYSKGIMTWEKLANTDPAIIKGYMDEAGPRYRMHDPTSWPRQSRLAANGEWAALDKLQDELDGGR